MHDVLVLEVQRGLFHKISLGLCCDGNLVAHDARR